MEKCSLCGGKILNGRCQDCGMPYPTEKRYTLRGETAHTHEVNGEKILHRVRLTPPARQGTTPQRQPRPNRERMGQPQDFHARAKRLVWGIVLLILGLNILSMLLAGLSA